ncbi:unnamed protein product [Toxocara canis]|uniref:P-type domain-containing protein n=1 Tax=Toxocara canis TaxID=6265 RepID=A0A183TWT3_TOXCA|nr:unnamed protein product [Toxocara canis]
MNINVRIVAVICALAIPKASTAETSSIPNHLRLDCAPDQGIDAYIECPKRGCWWTPANPDNINIPWCYFPVNTGYVASHKNASLTILKRYSKSPASPFGKTIDDLTLKQTQIGATLNVRIGYDGSYEPPVYIPRQPSSSPEKLSLVEGGSMSNINNAVYSFSITRGNGATRIWDTSIGGMLFADQYIQIATLLPSDNIYGFGENIHQNIKHFFDKYTTWGMFSRDQPPQSTGQPIGQNLYGVHPFYLGLEADGKAHGVLIWNSNAQEVTTGMGPHLVYRTIGGMLDIYFFPGPEPEQVIQQYQMLIGTPFLPAYWALGFQLSSYGYKTLSDLQFAVNRTINNNIPLDVVHADIDYMDRFKDFTIGQSWSGLGDYAKELHAKGMSLILILDPAIQVDSDAFNNALQQKASFIEWPQVDLVQNDINKLYPLTNGTKVMLGVVWPDRHVAFPDFLDPQNKTQAWWMKEITTLHTSVDYDGIWIDMNEPANFGTNEDNPWYWEQKQLAPLKCPLSGEHSKFDSPPYPTINAYQWGGALSSKTLCMLATTSRNTKRFYDTKNIYGLAEATATQTALFQATEKRGVVISRSTFPSAGHYAGHWLGDNTARWEDLRTSAIGAQEFNLFGIPYVGSDICGYNGATTEELCLRWHQLGAFHSFSRNHNGENNPPQDPGVWPAVAIATRQANLFRYQYLPYLYSLHFGASLYGGSVLRPVFFEFPNDSNTYDLGYQFMWGSAVIVVPALFPGMSKVGGYLPVGAAWYSLRESDYGQQVASGHQELSARLDELPPVLLKGTNGNQPTGELYWDDGYSIVQNNDFERHVYNHWTFTLSHVNSVNSSTVLKMSPTKIAPEVNTPMLDVIEIFGYDVQPNFSTLQMRRSGTPVAMDTLDKSKWFYNAEKRIVHIETKNFIDLSKPGFVELEWTNTP